MFYCMDMPYFDDGYLSCFHFLAIMNNATLNIHMQVSVLICFSSFGYIPGVEFLIIILVK